MRLWFIVIALIYCSAIIAGDFTTPRPPTPRLSPYDVGYVAPTMFEGSDEEDDLDAIEQEQMEFWLPLAERGSAQEFATALVEHEISQNVLITLKQLLSARSDLKGQELQGKLDIINILICNDEKTGLAESSPNSKKVNELESSGSLEDSLTESEFQALPLWLELIDNRPPAEFEQELETNDISENMMAVLGGYLRHSEGADVPEKLWALHNKIEKAPETQMLDIDTLRQGSLLKAIGMEDLEYADRLLDENKASLHEVDEGGNNALHWLMWKDDNTLPTRLELLRKMLKAGCDYNRQNKFGDMPIDLAYYSYKESSLVTELLHHGADCLHIDKKGRPLILSMMISLVPPLPWVTPQAMQTAFEEQVFVGNEKNIEKYFQYGVQINKVDKFGMTPLQRAALSQKPDLAKKLIACGAIVGSMGCDYSPYEYAFLDKNPKKELIDLFQKTEQDKKSFSYSLNACDLTYAQKAVADHAPLNMAIDDQGNTVFSSLVAKASKVNAPVVKAISLFMAKWWVIHGANPCLPISHR